MNRAPSPQVASGSEAADCTPLPKVYQGIDPYGGTIESYAFPDGSKTVVHVHRPNVDFDTAPEAEAIYYGLGPRPSSGNALHNWEGRAHARLGQVHPCLSTALGDRAAKDAHEGSQSGGGLGNYPGTSSNWSGVVHGSGSKSANYVLGSYDQTAYSNSCATSAAASSWVGLGGWNFVSGQQRLVQAGTTWDPASSSTKAFYEYLTEDAQGNVTSGQAMAVYLGTQSIPANHLIEPSVSVLGTEVSYDVYDATAQMDYAATEPSSGTEGSFVDGSTAEWIDERPTLPNGQLSNLRTWSSDISWGAAGNLESYTDNSTNNANPTSDWTDMTVIGASPALASITAPLTGISGSAWYNNWQSCYGSTPYLDAGETLWKTQALWSSNGSYEVTQQGDGNLVEYGPHGALWATNTSGSNNVTVMQTDGNLVVYNATSMLFQSGTGGHSPAAYHAVMQIDANFVIYPPSGPALWANGA